MPSTTPPPARATSALQTLLSDPHRPGQPLIWMPTCPSASLPGDLEARRRLHAQNIQAYRNQVRHLSQQAGVKALWVTQTLWGETTIEPV